MADPVTLIVFVASGGATDATTRAMARATRDALGSEARVELRETRTTPSDGEALSSERNAHADAVVELRWNDPARRQAMLRVHVARSGRWISRAIGFEASDADAERGRTIGFAVASMIPELVAPDEAQGTAALSPAPSSSAAPATASSAPPPPAASPSPNAPPDHEASPATVPGAPDTPTGLQSFAVDVLALGATGIGGTAVGFGGGAGLHWFALGPLSVRVGAGVRAGDVQGARMLTLLASAGVAFYPWRTTAARPFGLSIRADALFMRQSLSRADSTVGSYERPLSGVQGVVEAEWQFAPEVEVILGVGLEEVFAPTYVYFQGIWVATIPAHRALLEAGLRVRF